MFPGCADLCIDVAGLSAFLADTARDPSREKSDPGSSPGDEDAHGQTLNVQLPAIAKMEKRMDMYVSNLRAFIEAAGGQLRITAEFPDGDVLISNFADVGEVAGGWQGPFAPMAPHAL